MNAPVTPRTLLLDTCVWLDNYLGERPGAPFSRRLNDHAQERDINLAYAATTPKDVHYLVAQSLKRARTNSGATFSPEAHLADQEVAWACIDNMADLAVAVAVDESDLWLARKYRTLHADFEDNVVVAAAQRARADFLVTNDARLIQHAPVAAISPRDLIALLMIDG